jgi:hypothetical protein
MSATMPARYRLNEVGVPVNRETPHAVKATLPTVVIHNWMGLNVGDSIGVAPVSPDAVKLGPTVPAMLARVRIRDDHRSGDGRGRARLRRDSLDYLDVNVGDTVTYERRENGPVLLRVCRGEHDSEQ